MSRVLIITTSIRAKSNSDILAEKAAEGARETGHDVELISIKGKKIDCFEKAEFKGSLFCGGINDMGEAAGRDKELDEAYQFGKSLE